MIFLRTASLLCLIISLTACGGGGGGEDDSEFEDRAPLAVERALRIMPLGDSITSSLDGQASYRYWLYQDLIAAGLDVDFVGSQRGVYRGTPGFSDFDQDHEGHWDWRADEILARLPGWLEAYQPDIVLVHLGTNDIFQRQSISSTIDEMRLVIETIQNFLPESRIILSLVIHAGVEKGSRLPQYNQALLQMHSELSADFPAVVLVDQATGFDPFFDTVDDVHPDRSGELKIAANFLAAILQIAGE